MLDITVSPLPFLKPQSFFRSASDFLPKERLTVVWVRGDAQPPSIVCSDNSIEGGIASSGITANTEYNTGVLALNLIFGIVIVAKVQPAQGLQYVAVAILDSEIRTALVRAYSFPRADTCAWTGRGCSASEPVEDLAKCTADTELEELVDPEERVRGFIATERLKG
ncbi:hypothetical protein ONZ43_g825 [Nemania bipapillata]|uniref:Uncharacterized protein n=1 Tax=Nemania bipapillata TaxID=110536 RepID=A0ACC2J6X6_9PEZI|nr:hypothetical protein ONZ43_g825 [Nemania bipapillata]